MPIPVHMWLKDDGGAEVRGPSTVQGREGSIEVLSLNHGITLPVETATGKITGSRSHSPVTLEKEIDQTSPYLYQATATGKSFKSVVLKWYRIDDSGREKEYFRMSLDNVRVTGIHPSMPLTKLASMSSVNHMESVSLLYERIEWHYLDGNPKFSDSWEERA